jgi:hypothetical protein
MAVSHRLQGCMTNRPPKSPRPPIFTPLENFGRRLPEFPNLGVCVASRHSVTQVCAMSDLHDRPDDMIHVRLPAELRAAVERVAQEENRTLSGQIRHIIARAVKQPQQEGASA